MKVRTERRERTAVMILLVIGMFASLASAEPPWKKLIPFKTVDADPAKSYWLSEDDGPWLIFATSFAGPGAETEAHELVLELRKKFRLEAFMHKRHFDFSEPVYGRGLNKYGGPKRMKYRNATSFDEIAVLIGSYTAHDAPGAEEDLQSVKTIEPSCLAVSGNGKKETTQRFVVLRELQRLVNSDPQKKELGPLRRAFIARNPLLPKEFFVGAGLDSFVINMNKHVKHSLLDCPGKFTVRIASFRGKSRFVGESDQKADEGSWLSGLPGMNKPSELEIAAENAHRLTESLRDKGVEAYEFHDRFESVVTVGSFDSVGTELPNGRINLVPGVHQIMESYGAERANLPGHNDGLRPRVIDGVALDIQPMPVHVPRASISSNYAAGNHQLR